MRVIITTSTYFPKTDGVQNITAFYAEKLASDGHEVTVVTSRYRGMKKKEEHNGVVIIRVKVFTKKSIYYGDIENYKKLMIDMSSKADVIINVCLQTALTDSILDIVPLFKCKKILYLHGMAHFNFPNVPKIDIHDIMSWVLNNIRWKSFYKKAFNKISSYDQIIHLHKNDKTYSNCLKSGILNNTVIENGVHMRIDISSNISISDYYICVSNYYHDKNQEFVLKAYYNSKTKKKLIFVGSSKTKYYNKLIKINKELQNNGKMKNKEVIFLSNIPRVITEKYISNAFALLNGSKSEKYPVIICEALASGIPYISTDVGITKYIPGGTIVNSINEMVKNIGYIESDGFDRNYNSEQEKNYREKYQNMDKNYKKLLEIMQDN